MGSNVIFIYSYRHSVVQVLSAEEIFLPQWRTVVTCLDDQLDQKECEDPFFLFYLLCVRVSACEYKVPMEVCTRRWKCLLNPHSSSQAVVSHLTQS